MEVILDRIAAWAPRREVFNLFYTSDDKEFYVGTFSDIGYAVACARKLDFDDMYITSSYMDEFMTQKRVWHMQT
jgi:hypothetical protein